MLVDEAQVQTFIERLRFPSRLGNLILLHPETRNRTVFLSALLAEPPRPLFFYGFGTNDINIHSFLKSLVHDLAEQAPLFGRKLSVLLAEEYASYYSPTDDDLAQALLNDLTELCAGEHYLLVLDEYDLVVEKGNPIHQFLVELVPELPGHCHIILNSRSVPSYAWMALAAKRQATVLRGGETVVMRDINTFV